APRRYPRRRAPPHRLSLSSVPSSAVGPGQTAAGAGTVAVGFGPVLEPQSPVAVHRGVDLQGTRPREMAGMPAVGREGAKTLGVQAVEQRRDRIIDREGRLVRLAPVCGPGLLHQLREAV